jgi:enoyl-CoA hydratase/carnithine racemase
MSLSPTERMIARKDGAIGWMIFNNPERRNAVSLDMWEAIPTILEEFEKDAAIRVIVLTGAGERAFVSGADISEFAERRSTAETVRHYDAVAERASNALYNAAKPTVAMIRGWCVGGGVAVAITCDIRIAAEDARFGVPAARLGLGYKMSGVRRLMDLVGPAVTKDIFFTARHYRAAEALRMGLVNEVVPTGELEAFVRGYAGMIAENAPLTIAAVKRTVAELLRDPGQRDGAAVAAMIEACFASEDYREGRTAFMEKRPPRFRGR